MRGRRARAPLGAPAGTKGRMATAGAVIAASKGRTATAGTSAHAAPEHPRVGGENKTVWNSTVRPVGTPPRRRRELGASRDLHRDCRNTPASAGRTSARAPRACRPPEHPRVGGENADGREVRVTHYGTPPRRQGERLSGSGCPVPRRNTPASAGRTVMRSPPGSWPSEHPRVGGENRIIRDCAWRGEPLGSRCTCLMCRNTPASAGRTNVPEVEVVGLPEHPRVGGENPSPTRAGRPRGGTPPRRRGELEERLNETIRLRNTPASAGRTGAGRHPVRDPAEHPRVGGENAVRRPGMAITRGTPPRRRGELRP